MATAAPPVQHSWVKWSLVDVDVIVDPATGSCFAVESPEGGIGEQVCCHNCGEPLTDYSLLEPCRGDIADVMP